MYTGCDQGFLKLWRVHSHECEDRSLAFSLVCEHSVAAHGSPLLRVGPAGAAAVATFGQDDGEGKLRVWAPIGAEDLLNETGGVLRNRFVKEALSGKAPDDVVAVQFSEEDHWRSLCDGVMDRFADHALVCCCGGDCTRRQSYPQRGVPFSLRRWPIS